MKSIYFSAILCIFHLISSFQPYEETMASKTRINMPIICLTYDDGMESHILNAIPQLDSFGLKGTFFLNSISGISAVVGWKKAAINGHELGNHSLFHPCPRIMGWAEEIATENYSVERIVKEVETIDMMLKQIDPSVKTRSYAFPCNNHVVGGGKEYISILKNKGLIKFARTGGDRNSFYKKDSKLDPLKVISWGVEEGTTAQELIAFVDEVIKGGGLGVIQFHGIGGQWIKVSNHEHKTLLKYLKQQEKNVSVVTFSDAVAQFSN